MLRDEELNGVMNPRRSIFIVKMGPPGHRNVDINVRTEAQTDCCAIRWARIDCPRWHGISGISIEREGFLFRPVRVHHVISTIYLLLRKTKTVVTKKFADLCRGPVGVLLALMVLGGPAFNTPLQLGQSAHGASFQ